MINSTQPGTEGERGNPRHRRSRSGWRRRSKPTSRASPARTTSKTTRRTLPGDLLRSSASPERCAGVRRGAARAANLWRWSHSITDTQGIIAIAAAGGGGARARLAALLLSVSACAACAARSGSCWASRASRTWSPTRPRCRRPSRRCSGYVEQTAARLDGRLAEVEQALRGTIAHRALVRYDAYNELSGQQSMSIALLDEEQSGIVLSCIHHRDQARVYGKQVRGGRGEIELSPEEAEAVRLALAGAARAARRGCRRALAPEAPRPLPRVGYLGPEGTFTEEALLASARDGAVEPVRAGEHLRHGDGAARGRGELGDRADRELAGRVGGGHARPARRGGGRRGDRRRGAAGGAPLADRRRGRRARGDRDGAHAPAGAGAVRALPARRARARARAGGELDGGGGADWWRRTGARAGAAIGTVLAARDLRRRRCCARASRTARTTKRASCGWRASAAAARTPPLRGAAAGRWKTSLVFWGLGRRAAPGWLCAAWTSSPRRDDQPDADRVAAARAAPRQLHVLRRPRGPRERGARGGGDRGPALALRRRCACSAPTAPPPPPIRGGLSGRRSAAAREPPRYTAALKMESTVPPESVGSVSPSEHQRHGPETSPVTAMSGRVLVLNATYEPINVCTVRRAVVLLLKEQGRAGRAGRAGSCTPRAPRSPGRW